MAESLKLSRLRDDLLNASPTQTFMNSWPGMEPATTFYGYSGPRHRGFDYVLNNSGSVRAPASGTVLHIGSDYPGMGGLGPFAVAIQNPSGITYFLGHLHDNITTEDDANGHAAQTGPALQVGQLVRAGDIIGHQGSTGASTGPHVHVQVQNEAWRSAQNPIGLGNMPTRLSSADLFYTEYHALGYGTGANPGKEFASIPPDPSFRYNVPMPMPPYNTDSRLTGPEPVAPSVVSSQQAASVQCAKGYRRVFDKNTRSWTCVEASTVTTVCPPFFSPSGSNGSYPDCISDLAADGYTALGGASITDNIGNMLGAAMLAILGIVVIAFGLRALTQEKPVQVVTQPVVDATHTVTETAAKAGKLIAAVA